jgi:UDP-N-acetylglucosamine 2-epimerase
MFSREFRKRNQEIIVHTGQHYDSNMSKIFFDELDIPRPDFNLNIGSGSHGIQTANMLEKIESILIDNKPDALLVYGDTNSTLAGALASSKLHIPVIHVEAGLRSFNKLMPEEQNRILTDHISTYLFCPSQVSFQNLFNEGIKNNVYVVGDIMKDSVLYFSKLANNKYNIKDWIDSHDQLERYKNLLNKGFYLATIHRAENTDDISKMQIIFNAFSKLEYPVIMPIHPRTKKVIMSNFIETNNVMLVDPVGYLEMLLLQVSSRGIITDSGGLQKEAYILKKPCVTLRDQTEWVETLKNGWNKLSSIDVVEIVSHVKSMEKVYSSKYIDLYGDGKTSSLIVEILEREIKNEIKR